MRVHRSINEPIREGLTWHERWSAEDKGLIACWERGREMAQSKAQLADGASLGQLVVLPWKGGVERRTKQNEKYGTLNYLAMWLGLRGEDLDIDLDKEVSLTCSATDMTVTFTLDRTKYLEP